MATEFHRDYLLRLPLPIAQLYSRVHNAKDARARHDNSFYLFEALVKLAAAPAIACYLEESRQRQGHQEQRHQGQTHDAALDKLLAQLALPSLGQWVGMLRALAKHFHGRLNAAGGPHPLGHLWSQLDAKSKQRPGLLALFRRIKNGADGAAVQDGSCSLMQVVDALVQYRNEVFGHGANRPESFYSREMGPLLVPAANELLAEGVFEFLGPPGSQLVVLADIRSVGDRQVEVGLRELMGVQGQQLPALRLPQSAAADLAPERMAVLWPGRAAPLRIDPLAIYREGDLVEEVLFLNRDRNGKQVEYLSYTSGRTERDAETAPALASLLSQIARRAVSESELDDWAEMSRAATPALERAAAEREGATASPSSTKSTPEKPPKPDPSLALQACDAGPAHDKPETQAKKPAATSAGSTSTAKPRKNQLGNYDLLAKLGEGGMGAVYKARHRVMNRLVALKVVRSAAMKDPVVMQRFLREVQVVARLQHPNIVGSFDADQADGIHFLVLEFVDGPDLSQRVREQGPLSPAEAVECIAQAARGLEHAHAAGIVHRDIKPANLLRDRQGTVKILDLGLAQFKDGPEDGQNLTQTGQVVGTVTYMSPEQALSTKHVDPRTDIYSLGCTLYFLLTGRPPYKGETAMHTLLDHRESPIPSLADDVPAASPELDAVFQQMVAKKPNERYATMSDCRVALEACLTPDPVAISAESHSGTSANTQAMTRQDLGSTSAIGDTALAAFLNGDAIGIESPEATATTFADADPTAEQEPRPTRFQQAAEHARSHRGWWIGGAAAAFFSLLVAAAIILRLETPAGVIELTVDQPGAEVTVDGQRRVVIKQAGEETPITIEAIDKKHELKVTKSGFEVYVRELRLEKDGKQSIHVKLVPLVPPGKAPPKFVGNDPRPVVLQPVVPVAPPLAIAGGPKLLVSPFDKAAAVAAQQGWAAHLKQKVEESNSIGMKLVLIPPGEFQMGAPASETEAGSEERPQHPVRITKPYYLGQCEVTRGQYAQFAADAKITDERWKKTSFVQDDSHPVVYVSWADGTKFCEWLSVKEGKTYRLPTEAEWEYACRAGTATKYSHGDDDAKLGEYAWYSANSKNTTHTTGEKLANGFGLYDMHGNVLEWCGDWYGDTYYGEVGKALAIDPRGASVGSDRVFRGGCWFSSARDARSARRSWIDPSHRNHILGFRVVRVPDVVISVSTPPAVVPASIADGPKLLVAPFDKAAAVAAQQAWAAHLKQKVEETNSIGMKLLLIPPHDA